MTTYTGKIVVGGVETPFNTLEELFELVVNTEPGTNCWFQLCKKTDTYEHYVGFRVED